MAKDIYGTQYELTLSHDEVYTMCLLLSHVAKDNECYRILDKLERVIGRELTLEDFERVVVKVEGEEVGDDWTILID